MQYVLIFKFHTSFPIKKNYFSSSLIFGKTRSIFPIIINASLTAWKQRKRALTCRLTHQLYNFEFCVSSDHELQPTMWKQCSITNLPKGRFLAGPARWSMRGPHYKTLKVRKQTILSWKQTYTKATIAQTQHKCLRSSDTWEACYRQRSCDRAWEQPCGELWWFSRLHNGTS